LNSYPTSTLATPRTGLIGRSIASNVPQLNPPIERLPTATARSRSTATLEAPRTTADDDSFNLLPSSDLSLPSTASIRSPRSKSLSTPNSDSLAPVTVNEDQAIGARKYFQQRWKADPNFQEALQYRLQVGQDGRVLTIEGQTTISREYLSRTNFLKPGTLIAEGSYNQTQNVLLILKADGSVEAL
jgi:hypothetical protein